MYPCLWLCSEEKIEFAGALGKADVSNRMLDDIERDLEELWAAAQLDSFCLYVYGLVLADRYVMLGCLSCTTVDASCCCARHTMSHCFQTATYLLHSDDCALRCVSSPVFRYSIIRTVAGSIAVISGKKQARSSAATHIIGVSRSARRKGLKNSGIQIE